MRLEFTKQEIEQIKSKIYLTDLQEKILDMKLKGDLTEYGMAIKLGASEETDKSFHYMVKALEDFIKVLHEEAETPQQKQMLNETLQRSMM